MKHTALVITGICAALFVLLALGSLVQQASTPSALTYARQDAEINRLRREDAQASTLQPLDLALAAGWRVLPLAACVGALLYAASLGVAHIARFRHERMPDSRGLLPVLSLDQRTAQLALSGFHTARIEDARRANVPHSLAYHAPHYRTDSGGIPLLPAHVTPALGAPIPTFGELLTSGRIGQGQPLMLGHDLTEDTAIWGSWRDLYSAGVGGQQGGGKSWTAASLIAQSMLNGARVILCDPHASDEESLTRRLAPLLPFMAMYADDDHQIEQAARYAADELSRRRDTKHPDRTPVLLVIDEWTSLLRRGLGDTLPGILSDLTQQGRKFGVNAMLLAQRWSVEAAGGGDVRNCLTAHYVHRTRSDEARMQTGLRGGALPDDTMTLLPGQCYLVDTKGGVRKVATPHMEADDLSRVAAMLGDGTQATTGRVIVPPADAWGKPEGSLREARDDQASRPSESSAAIPAEALRVRSLFMGGMPLPAVVFEIKGVKSSEGRRYQIALTEVQELLRAAMGAA